MIEYVVLDSGAIGKLTLNGRQTVQNGDLLRKAILSALEQTRSVVLDLGKSDEADLSFLQVLCSAHRTAIRLNKNLAIERASEAVLRAVDSAGYARHTGCSLDVRKSCLWAGAWRR
jgi:anti-anti-sigma regulatory factor